MLLKDNELIMINGGSTAFSGTLLNAVAKLMDTVLGVGRTIGSALRMIVTGRKC